jgi:hypothetical protein
VTRDVAASTRQPDQAARELRLIDRVRRHLRFEDVLLFAWLILAPLLFSGGRSGATTTSDRDPLAGLIGIAALCGVAICLGSRSRDGSRSGLVSNGDLAYAVGPLFGAVAFALDTTTTRLGLGGGLEWLPLALAIAAGVAAHWVLPPLTVQQRRGFVVPFVLMASAFFGQVMSGLGGIFDLRLSLSAIGDGQLMQNLVTLGFATLGSLVFYLMFVFAPRQIAEREGTTLTWAVRFAVFLVSLSLGTTLQAAIP